MVHSLSCLVYQSPCILHMSRHGGIDLSLAIILHRICSKLSTFTTYERFAFLVNFMIRNIDERLNIIGTSSTIWLVIILLSGWVLLSARIIQAMLWCVNDRTLTCSSPTLLGIRALILWLLWPLWGPGKSTHSVWKFTLSFSNDFERLLLILEEKTIFVTVRCGICDAMDGTYRPQAIRVHIDLRSILLLNSRIIDILCHIWTLTVYWPSLLVRSTGILMPRALDLRLLLSSDLLGSELI